MDQARVGEGREGGGEKERGSCFEPLLLSYQF